MLDYSSIARSVCETGRAIFFTRFPFTSARDSSGAKRPGRMEPKGETANSPAARVFLFLRSKMLLFREQKKTREVSVANGVRPVL